MTGDLLAGRDQELSELTAILFARRIVLLYAQSGCGKTSLIEAGLRSRLIKQLEEGRGRLFPLPTIVSDVTVEDLKLGTNALLAAVMRQLRQADGHSPPLTAPELKLSDLLSMPRRPPTGEGRTEVFNLLIFDQFERVFTTPGISDSHRLQFFKELGLALENRKLWAIFAIREDFLGALEPYRRYLPTQISTQFRLRQLSLENAQTAMIAIAKTEGVCFEEPAAKRLADDLASPGGTITELEPVYLQVACRHIWKKRTSTSIISVDDVSQSSPGQTHTSDKISPVDRALAQYYEDCIKNVLDEKHSEETVLRDWRERLLRDWIERAFITEKGHRMPVSQPPAEALEFSDKLFSRLEEQYLIRPIQRTGATYYELTHDRLLVPILIANREWRDRKLTPFQKRAVEWARAGRPNYMYLDGPPLEEASQWLKMVGTKATEDEKQLYAQSYSYNKERRLNRSVKGLTSVLLITLLSFVILGLASYRSSVLGNVRKLADSSTKSLTSDPERSILLALQSIRDSRWTQMVHPVPAEASAALSYAMLGSHLHLRIPNAAPVTALLFSMDDPDIVFADEDGIIRKVDAITGEEKFRRLQGPRKLLTATLGSHLAAVRSVIASAGDSRELSLFALPARSLQKIALAPGDRYTIYAVTVSPNGEALAVGSSLGLRTAKIERGAIAPRSWISLDATPAYQVLFSMEGNRLISANEAGVVTVREVSKLSTPRTLHTTGSLLRSMAVSRLGNLLAITTDRGEVAVLNTDTSALISLPAGDRDATAVAITAAGDRVAVGHVRGRVEVWDVSGVASGEDVANQPGTNSGPHHVRPGVRLLSLDGQEGPISALAFSPDGRLLASAGLDADTSVELSAGSARKYSIRIWDVASRPIQRVIEASDLSADGRSLVMLSQASAHDLSEFDEVSNSVAGWKILIKRDTATGEETRVGVCNYCVDVSVSANGHRVAIAGYNDNRVFAVSGGIIKPPTNRFFSRAVLSGDGGTLATLEPEGLKLWRLDEDRDSPFFNWDYLSVIAPPAAQPSRITSVALSEDGLICAAGREDGSVDLWQAKVPNTEEVIKSRPEGKTKLRTKVQHYLKIDGFGSRVSAVALSSRANSQYIAIGTVYGSVSVHRLNLVPLKQYSILPPTGIFDGAPIVALRFAHNDGQLAVGGNGGLRLLDVSRPKESNILSEESFQDLAFTANDDQLVTTSPRSGSVLTWPLPGEKTIEKAYHSISRSLSLRECVSYLQEQRCPSDVGVLGMYVDAVSRARRGEVEQAEILLRQALAGMSGWGVGPVTATGLRSQALVERAEYELGYSAATDTGTTTAHLEHALEDFKSAYRLHPDTQTIPRLFTLGEHLAATGKIDGAVMTYHAIEWIKSFSDRPDRYVRQRWGRIDGVDYLDLSGPPREDQSSNDILNHFNNVCFYGALYKRAHIVMDYCTKAVKLEESITNNDRGTLDSRGLARAVDGDVAGAVEDFNNFIDRNPKNEANGFRKAWLECATSPAPNLSVCTDTLVVAMRRFYLPSSGGAGGT